MLIVATGLPATAALLYYMYTGDPTLRPFGISKNSLSRSDTPQALLEILVRVEWGQSAPGTTSRAGVRQILHKAMGIYEIDYRVQFRETAGDQIKVFYIVEHNRLGPYPLHNAAQGIPAALAAFRAMRTQ